MEITILGSGTILSGPHRNPAGFFLKNGKRSALLDCGPGILRRLKEQQIDILDIQTIFLTHFHLDHCADVFPLLMNRALLKNGVNANLTIYGPHGLVDWFGQIRQTQGSWLTDALPQLVELDEKPLQWADLTVRYFYNGHTESSVSYRFEKKGNSVFFSGDCGYTNELAQFAHGAALAFTECSYPDEAAQEGHLTPGELRKLAEQCRFDHLVLIHIYPENDTPDLLRRVGNYSNGKITVGQDLMRFSI
ncbi:MAG TPA: MBL fold metallo-hydrolase [Caldithrix abyssi]|uniref:MBL fold metallo-hydrolase n=1 Tax=Caldithrix abyssi TaxID=187145 RepID=A0A7V4WVT4_CALAY|nr:MBL fold metallo-hydrolase [Caldithrix abyssi]